MDQLLTKEHLPDRATDSGPAPEVKIPVAKEPGVGPESLTRSSQLGNSVVASAAVGGSSFIGESILPMQSVYGNAAVAHSLESRAAQPAPTAGVFSTVQSKPAESKPGISTQPLAFQTAPASEPRSGEIKNSPPPIEGERRSLGGVTPAPKPVSTKSQPAKAKPSSTRAGELASTVESTAAKPATTRSGDGPKPKTGKGAPGKEEKTGAAKPGTHADAGGKEAASVAGEAGRSLTLPKVGHPLLEYEIPVEIAASLSQTSDLAFRPAQIQPETGASHREAIALLNPLVTDGQTSSAQLTRDALRAKAQVTAAGLAQERAARQRTTTTLADMKGKFAKARADVKSGAEAHKKLISAQIALDYLIALAESAKQVVAIKRSAVDYRSKAQQAVKSRQTEMTKFGSDEGNRGKKEVDQQAQSARERGQTKARGYPTDDRGKAQASAVLKVAEETAAKLAEPGPDLKKEITKAGAAAAEKLNGAENDTVKEIEEKAEGAAAQIIALSPVLKLKFDSLHDVLVEGVDKAAAETIAGINSAELAANLNLRLSEINSIQQIRKAVSWAHENVDRKYESAAAYIASTVAKTSKAVEREKRPRLRSVRRAVANAHAELQSTTEQFATSVDAAAKAIAKAFNEAGTASGDGMANMAASAGKGMARVTAAMNKGFGKILTQAGNSTRQIIESWGSGKALTETQKTLDGGFKDSVGALEKELDKGLPEGKKGLTDKVDETVLKNQEGLADLDSKMEDAAAKARKEYDAAWYDKFFTWDFWGGFLSALGWGILKVLGVILVAVLAVVLIIVGIVEGIVALIVIGVALLVGAILYVVWGILKGIYERWKSASGFWQSAWSVVVGILDIVGVPNIIEGIIGYDIVNGRELTDEEAGNRLGAGLLGIVLWLLPAKLRGGKVHPEIKTEIEVPEIKAPEVTPGEVKPGELKPGEVTPGEVTPGEVKPGDVKPGDVKPGDVKPGDVKPEVKPSDIKPDEPGGIPEKEPPAKETEHKPSDEQKQSTEKPKQQPEPEQKTEPKTEEAKVEEAKLEEAEAAATGDRLAEVRTKADLAKLKEQLPTKDKPPSGTELGDPNWNGYVDYFQKRLGQIEEELGKREGELAKNPKAKLKNKPPLKWEPYRDLHETFGRGRGFQKRTTEALKKEKPNQDIQQDVGVKKGDASTKFADQLGVDKAELEAWEKAKKPKDKVPEVETYSDKSRTQLTDVGKIEEQVKADVNEALEKYGGEIEIRRPGHPLFGFIAKVKQVTLIFEADHVPPELRPLVKEVANKARAESGVKTPLEVEFR